MFDIRTDGIIGSGFDVSEFVATANKAKRTQRTTRAKRSAKFTAAERTIIFNERPYNMVETYAANSSIKTLHAKLWPEIQRQLPKRKRKLTYAEKKRIDKARLNYSERLTRALVDMTHRAGCTAVSRNKDEIEQILIDIQDAYEAVGYCEICLSEKGGKHQSRMIPLEKFKQLLTLDPWDYKQPINYYFELRERKKAKKDKPVLLAFNKSSHAIEAIQYENEIINDAHATISITYEPEFSNGTRTQLRPVFKTIGTAANANELPTKKNCRNYTGHAGHQNLKSTKDGGYNERSTIYFDSEPNFEADYSALFISMIYHRAGLKIAGDPYWLWDEKYNENNDEHFSKRQLSKLTHNTLINAKTESEALASLENESRWYETKGGKKVQKPHKEYKTARRLFSYLKISGLNYRKLIELVKIKHAAIASTAFGNDLGIKLMAIEGKIARRVMVHFSELRKPCLGTHDSFQVARSDAAELIETMRAEYFKIFYQYPKLKYDGRQIATLDKISHSSIQSNTISSNTHTHYLRTIELKKPIKDDKNLQKTRCNKPTQNCPTKGTKCSTIANCNSQSKCCNT